MAQSCCSAHAGVGCDDQACQDAVCACDPFCCNVQWDAFCAGPGFDPDCLCGEGTCGVDNTAECAFCQVNGGCDCDVPVGIGCPANQACEDCVCGQDTFCCDVAWDGLCVGRATGVCADACCNGNGNGTDICCTDHGEIGCSADPSCEACVCGQDGFCCEVAWDGLCAGRAAGVCCDSCACCDGNGDPDFVCKSGNVACTAPGGIGCPECPECEAAVCACDPFCCDVSWDAFCASDGFDPDCLCGEGTCGVNNTEECCDTDCPGPPQCDCDVPVGIGCPANQACEDCVCGQDTFCCDVAWDGLCVGRATGVCADACCGEVCPDCVGDITGDNNVGVDDLLELLACWGEVEEGCECADLDGDSNVGVDDLLILLAAWGECPEPEICPPSDADCCFAHPGVGCEDEQCCNAVCVCDPFCCEVQWDGFCAGPGFDPDCLCGVGGCGVDNTPECDHLECPGVCGGPGDCCTAHGGIGCEDEPCCECVCGQDGFCCDVAWDGLCQGRATGVCCDSCECCNGNGECDCDQPVGIGCPQNAACEKCVCGQDSFCCDVAWDGLCVGRATGVCADACCNGPVNGEICCTAHGEIGCSEDPSCESCVCGQDSFCCDIAWDGLCAGRATGVCCDSCACCSPTKALCDTCAEAGNCEIFDGPNEFSTIGTTTTGPAHDLCLPEWNQPQIHNDNFLLYVATSTGTLRISTCNTATFDTFISAYASDSVCTDATIIGCNDDGPGCAGFTSQLDVSVTQGQSYVVRVGAFSSGSVGTGTVTLSYLD